MLRTLKILILSVRRFLLWLWAQEGSAGERARGFAFGVFSGCFPFFGLQILIGITLASLFKGNRLLAVTGTWISNPFTYLPLYWFNYQVGRHILGNGQNSTVPNRYLLQNFWEQGWDMIFCVLAGSVLVGFSMSIVIWGLTYMFLKSATKRRNCN